MRCVWIMILTIVCAVTVPMIAQDNQPEAADEEYYLEEEVPEYEGEPEIVEEDVELIPLEEEEETGQPAVPMPSEQAAPSAVPTSAPQPQEPAPVGAPMQEVSAQATPSSQPAQQQTQAAAPVQPAAAATPIAAQEAPGQPQQPTSAPSVPQPNAEQLVTPTPEQQRSMPENYARQVETPAQGQPQPTPSAQPEPSAPMAPSTTQQPSAQQPVEQKPQYKVAEGFDTVNIQEPSGNWLYKRIWWEKAQKRYDKIQGEMNQVLESRMAFLTKQHEAGETIFEPLLINMGLSQGELNVILADLIHEIEVVKAIQGGKLTPEQKDFLDKIAVHQKSLEQLQQDVQAIATIDRELEEDINELEKQITRARGYEKEAWDDFQTIGKELSDVKARTLYYTIETLEKNVGDILQYINTTLSSHFDQLIKVAREQADRITTTMQSLKEKGIDFKKHAQAMEKQAAQKQHEQSQAEKQEAIEKALQEQEQASSWSARFGRLWDSIIAAPVVVWDSLVGGIAYLYNGITGLFSGSDQPNGDHPGDTTQPQAVQLPTQAKDEQVVAMPVQAEAATSDSEKN